MPILSRMDVRARGPAPIRYGPAGWDYKDWQGCVYPEPRPRGFDPLRYLSAFFGTVEINTTFYRPLAPEVARTWLRRVSGNPDFRFTTKLYRRFTHERAETWTRREEEEARAGLEVLRDAGRLGAVLLQFPWSFRDTPENRAWLDDLLGALEGLAPVVEVRHVSWAQPAFYAWLHERGAGIVNIDQPQFRNSVAPSARATAPVGYVRIHGRNYKHWWRSGPTGRERYDYLYTTEELEPWAERTREVAESAGVREVYVVANNHTRGQGPANALMLQSLIERRRVPAPLPLFRAFADVLAPHAAPAEPSPGRQAQEELSLGM